MGSSAISEAKPKSSVSKSNVPQIRIPFYTPIPKIILEILPKAYEQYGDVLEIKGFPARVYCFRRPDDMAAIYRDKVVGISKLPGILPRVQKVMGQGGYILKGGDQWRRQRAMVKEAFNKENMNQWANVVPGCVRSQIRALGSAWSSGEPIDLCTFLGKVITQANYEMYFSERIADKRLEQIRRWTHTLEMNFLGLTPLWMPTISNMRFNYAHNKLRQDVLRLISNRRDRPNNKNDLLNHVLRFKHETSGENWVDKEVLGELFSVYLGAAVMGTTLSWAMSLIVKHNEVQQRLIDEIHTVLQGQTPTAEDLPKLKYLQYVLQEAMRFYPASWGYPRWCENGMRVGDVDVPPKTLVIPMVYHAHFHPDYWDDPQTFNPDRFDTTKRSSKYNPNAYMPFGAGPRKCMGASLGPKVLRLVLATLFQRYRFSYHPDYSSEPEMAFGFEIHPKDPIMMRAVGKGL